MTKGMTAGIWRVFSFAAFIAFFSMAAATSFAQEASAEASVSPAQFVKKLGDTALMSLTAKNVDRKTREKRVREILQNNFDVAAIGRFALGTYWKDASETQRKEYMNLFEDMIVQTYTTRFEDYSGQILKVGQAKKAGEKDTIVDSQVLQQDGPPINLEWRVRKNDGALRVVDVVVEGVSMSVTQRSDFAAVIQHGGGDIDSLIGSLRERKKAAAQKT